MTTIVKQPTDQKRDGAAVTEAAICLPVLAFIIFAAVEISSGIFHEYNIQASCFEISKVALRSNASCADVQSMANQVLPHSDFETYTVTIEVEPRTVNQDSVEPTSEFTFEFTSDSVPPEGLENLPRGTLLRLTLTADRPPVVGLAFVREYFPSQIDADSVFIKEF